MTEHPDLTTILDPSLLTKLVSLFFPWPPSDEPEAASIRDLYYSPSSNLPKSIHALCASSVFEPLLDVFGETSIADLTSHDLLQSPPSANSFPQQALGLALLLDAAPRLSEGFPGQARLTHAISGPLATRLAGQLFTLPASLRPDSPERLRNINLHVGDEGKGELSYAHTALMRLWLYAPLIHSEDYADQHLASGLLESLRRDTEAHYGVRDPTRRSDRAIPGDVGALARLVKGGPPPCGGRDVHTMIYWSAMVARAHAPVVRVFGRFPDRNAVLGREDTEEEKEKGYGGSGKLYSACG